MAGADFGQADLQARLARWQQQGEAETRVLTRIAGDQYRLVDLDVIVEVSPDQTRGAFNPETEPDDAELVESLRALGQITPVVLTGLPPESQAGPRYRIVAGHRRVAALRQLGVARVKAMVVQADSAQLALLTLAENIYRPLTAFEAWQGLDRLIRRGLDKESIARQAGRSLSAINRLLRVGELGEELRQALEQQQLPLRVALALGNAPLPLQAELAAFAQNLNLTEKQADELAAAVRERFLAEGKDAVDLASIAETLGQLPAQRRPSVKTESAHPAARPGRKPETPLDSESASRLLQATFTDADPRDVAELAEQAVRCQLNRKALRLAGLFLAEGKQTASQAAERMQRLRLSPDVRHLAAMLESTTQLSGLMARGQVGPEAAELLGLLARRLGKVKAAKRTGAGRRRSR